MSGEIGLAINILKVIDNPRQDIPLMSVMMSPVFGFSPDEISELRTETRTGIFEEDKKLVDIPYFPPIYQLLCNWGQTPIAQNLHSWGQFSIASTNIIHKKTS